MSIVTCFLRYVTFSFCGKVLDTAVYLKKVENYNFFLKGGDCKQTSLAIFITYMIWCDTYIHKFLLLHYFSTLTRYVFCVLRTQLLHHIRYIELENISNYPLVYLSNKHCHSWYYYIVWFIFGRLFYPSLVIKMGKLLLIYSTYYVIKKFFWIA